MSSERHHKVNLDAVSTQFRLVQRSKLIVRRDAMSYLRSVCPADAGNLRLASNMRPGRSGARGPLARLSSSTPTIAGMTVLSGQSSMRRSIEATSGSSGSMPPANMIRTQIKSDTGLVCAKMRKTVLSENYHWFLSMMRLA